MACRREVSTPKRVEEHSKEESIEHVKAFGCPCTVGSDLGGSGCGTQMM